MTWLGRRWWRERRERNCRWLRRIQGSETWGVSVVESCEGCLVAVRVSDWSEMDRVGRLVRVVVGLSVVERHQRRLVRGCWRVVRRGGGLVRCWAGVVDRGWSWSHIGWRWGLVVSGVSRRWLMVWWDWIRWVGGRIARQSRVVWAGSCRTEILGRPLLLFFTRFRSGWHNPLTILGSQIGVGRERISRPMCSVRPPLMSEASVRHTNVPSQLVGVVDGLVGRA